MAERELNILIRVKDFFTAPFKKLGESAKGAKAPLDDLGKSGEKTAGIFSRLASAIASRFVITLGDAERVLRGIVGVFGSAVTAANEQEAATARLNEALRQTGQFTPAASKALQDLSTALQKETVFSDEAIQNVEQLLIQFGHLATGQVPAATRAVIGLASAKKIDLATAATVVSKALAGETGALTRFGIAIDTTKTGTALYAEIIAKLSPLFGQATVDANTFAGGLARIKNQIGEQLETIGNAVIKNQELGAAFSEIARTLSDPTLVDGVARFAATLASISATGIKEVAAAITGLTDNTSVLGASITVWNRYTESIDQNASAAERMINFTKFLAGGFKEQVDALVASATTTRALKTEMDGLLVTSESLRAAQERLNAAILSGAPESQLAALRENVFLEQLNADASLKTAGAKDAQAGASDRLRAAQEQLNAAIRSGAPEAQLAALRENLSLEQLNADAALKTAGAKNVQTASYERLRVAQEQLNAAIRSEAPEAQLAALRERVVLEQSNADASLRTVAAKHEQAAATEGLRSAQEQLNAAIRSSAPEAQIAALRENIFLEEVNADAALRTAEAKNIESAASERLRVAQELLNNAIRSNVPQAQVEALRENLLFEQLNADAAIQTAGAKGTETAATVTLEQAIQTLIAAQKDAATSSADVVKSVAEAAGSFGIASAQIQEAAATAGAKQILQGRLALLRQLFESTGGVAVRERDLVAAENQYARAVLQGSDALLDLVNAGNQASDAVEELDATLQANADGFGKLASAAKNFTLELKTTKEGARQIILSELVRDLDTLREGFAKGLVSRRR